MPESCSCWVKLDAVRVSVLHEQVVARSGFPWGWEKEGRCWCCSSCSALIFLTNLLLQTDVSTRVCWQASLCNLHTFSVCLSRLPIRSATPCSTSSWWRQPAFVLMLLTWSTWLWHDTRYIAKEKRKTTSENLTEAATWQDKWSPDQVTQRESRSSSQFLRSQPACMQLSIHAPADRHGEFLWFFLWTLGGAYPTLSPHAITMTWLVLFCGFTTPTFVDRTVDRRPALTTIVVPTFRQSLWTQHLRGSTMNGTSFMCESREVWRKSRLFRRMQRRSAFKASCPSPFSILGCHGNLAHALSSQSPASTN